MQLHAYYPTPLRMLGIEKFALGKLRLKFKTHFLQRSRKKYKRLLGKQKLRKKESHCQILQFFFKVFKNQKIPFAWACSSGTDGRIHLQYSSASCCMVTAWLAGDFSCTSYLKFSLHTIFRFTWMEKVKGKGVF